MNKSQPIKECTDCCRRQVHPLTDHCMYCPNYGTPPVVSGDSKIPSSEEVIKRIKDAASVTSSPVKEAKSFFDLPESEKKEIIQKAAEESGKEMREFMASVKAKNHIIDANEMGNPGSVSGWEKRFEKDFVWNDEKGYTFVNEPGKQRVKAFIKAELSHYKKQLQDGLKELGTHYDRECNTYTLKISDVKKLLED